LTRERRDAAAHGDDLYPLDIDLLYSGERAEVAGRPAIVG
jgi:hypothetical protein